MASNQRAKPGFETEPVQAHSVPCQMGAGHSRAPLKKSLPEHGSTLHYTAPVLFGVCDVILLGAAFSVDNSWLVRMHVDEKACVTSLSIFLLVISFTIIHSRGLLLNHPVSKSLGMFPKMYLRNADTYFP